MEQVQVGTCPDFKPAHSGAPSSCRCHTASAAAGSNHGLGPQASPLQWGWVPCPCSWGEVQPPLPPGNGTAACVHSPTTAAGAGWLLRLLAAPVCCLCAQERQLQQVWVGCCSASVLLLCTALCPSFLRLSRGHACLIGCAGCVSRVCVLCLWLQHAYGYCIQARQGREGGGLVLLLCTRLLPMQLWLYPPLCVSAGTLHCRPGCCHSVCWHLATWNSACCVTGIQPLLAQRQDRVGRLGLQCTAVSSSQVSCSTELQCRVSA
jgi:hypothetical protein